MLLGVSRTLRNHLVASIPNPATNWVEITALQHDEPLALPQNKLVVFLYAVEENAFLRNNPPVPLASGEYVPAPLALTLQYLITYVSNAASDTQEWLTEVMRVFASTPRLGPAELDPGLIGTVDHLTVRLRSLELEDLNRLWTALNVGMRLALYYEVNVALIAPGEPETSTPVSERRVLLSKAGAP